MVTSILVFLPLIKMKNKTAVFPGSFDPFTKGHEYVVKKALEIFEEVVIGIGINTSKKYLFSIEKRIAQIESIYKENPKVKIRTYDGLTTKFCKSIDVSHIVRGLRNTIDFEYEKSIAEMNFTLDKIDTVFFISRDDIGAINASIVREIFKSKGRIDSFVSCSEKLV